MNASSSTTEGQPSRCPVCGKKVWVTPSVPPGDATCPHCGSLLWFSDEHPPEADPIRRLHELGAEVQVDAEGEVREIRFSGTVYHDAMIHILAELRDVEVIDLRETAISSEGVEFLRAMFPGTTILQ